MPISRKPISRMVIDQLIENHDPQAIKKYSVAALANPDLQAIEKLLLLELNQGDRLTIIKQLQQHTYENIFNQKEKFYTRKYHYDWWMFPMNVPVAWGWQERNYHASVNFDEAKQLLNDSKFVDTYELSVSMYIDAIVNNGWDNHPVRYARILQSLGLFLSISPNSLEMETTYNRLVKIGAACIAYAKNNPQEYELLDDPSSYPLLNEGIITVSSLIAPEDQLHSLHNSTPSNSSTF